MVGRAQVVAVPAAIQWHAQYVGQLFSVNGVSNLLLLLQTSRATESTFGKVIFEKIFLKDRVQPMCVFVVNCQVVRYDRRKKEEKFSNLNARTFERIVKK